MIANETTLKDLYIISKNQIRNEITITKYLDSENENTDSTTFNMSANVKINCLHN